MPVHGERKELREAMLRDLHGLQADWQRIAQRAGLKIRARLREAQFRLGDPSPRGRPGLRDMRAALALLSSVRIKPDKGRAKDLLRIEMALEEVLRTLPSRER
jgi:hypothetical protein